MIELERLFALLEPLYGHKQVQKWRQNKAAVHLALMQGDFLEAIIDGSKTIESRFSKARIAPIEAIEPGDLVLFKQVGRDFCAVGVVDRVKSGPLDPNAWTFVRANAEEIGIDDDYMDYKADAQYYALAWMSDVHQIQCVPIEKRDRRSWVILSAKRTSS